MQASKLLYGGMQSLSLLDRSTWQCLIELASVGRQAFLTRLIDRRCRRGCQNPVLEGCSFAQGGAGECGNLAALGHGRGGLHGGSSILGACIAS